MNKKIKLEFTTDNLAVPEIQVDELSDEDNESGVKEESGEKSAHTEDSSAAQPDSEDVEEEENEEFYNHLAFPEYHVKKPSVAEEQ